MSIDNPGQPDSAPSRTPTAPVAEPPASPARRRWFARPVIVVSIAIALVAVIALAVGIPLGLHAAAVAKADAAGRSYLAKVARFDAAWTSDAVTALAKPTFSATLATSKSFAEQPKKSVAKFTKACTAIAKRDADVRSLEKSVPPTLRTVDAGKDSKTFRKALAASARIQSIVEAVRDFATAIQSRDTALATMCSSVPKRLALETKYSTPLDSLDKRSATMARGSTETMTDSRYILTFTCKQAHCIPFFTVAKRMAYAKSYAKLTKAWYAAEVKASSGTACFLPLAKACAARVAATKTAAKFDAAYARAWATHVTDTNSAIAAMDAASSATKKWNAADKKAAAAISTQMVGVEGWSFAKGRYIDVRYVNAVADAARTEITALATSLKSQLEVSGVTV